MRCSPPFHDVQGELLEDTGQQMLARFSGLEHDLQSQIGRAVQQLQRHRHSLRLVKQDLAKCTRGIQDMRDERAVREIQLAKRTRKSE